MVDGVYSIILSFKGPEPGAVERYRSRTAKHVPYEIILVDN